jgi:chitin synthase
MAGSNGAAQPGMSRESCGLFHGNLILDCPVPPKLLKTSPSTHSPRIHTYGDPSEFLNQRFSLREWLFAQRRHTELFIVVTIYNEGDLLFARTTARVFENIEYICSAKGIYGGS